MDVGDRGRTPPSQEEFPQIQLWQRQHRVQRRVGPRPVMRRGKTPERRTPAVELVGGFPVGPDDFPAMRHVREDTPLEIIHAEVFLFLTELRATISDGTVCHNRRPVGYVALRSKLPFGNRVSDRRDVALMR